MEEKMPYNINHIHLKSEDPKSTADWFVKAFNVKIISDTVRHFGDRFIVTKSENDITINISGVRDGEKLGPSDGDAHFGLEHFGIDTNDIEADITRLVEIGAILKEGPIAMPDGRKLGFITAPGEIRIELIETPKE
jgi:lactoylglutathione lyase